MNVLDIVRRRIQLLYEKHPNIHVNVTLKRPHKVIVNLLKEELNFGDLFDSEEIRKLLKDIDDII